jgi:hypothetical protein
MSEISKIYSQYHDSLDIAHRDHEERIKISAAKLVDEWNAYMKGYVVNFGGEFSSQIRRQAIRRYAEDFFGTTDIPFVAIDGSCSNRTGTDFISFYGGAYGSRGIVSLTGEGGKLRYLRWEFSRDISVVAFVPIPPEFASIGVDDDPDAESPRSVSDQEIGQITSLHTKIMQLAEVYLAYSLVKGSTVEAPRLVLMDNSVSGILANTSFSPNYMTLHRGVFGGLRLNRADLYVGLSHPFSKELHIPSAKDFQPQFRLIAESHWSGSRKVSLAEASDFSKEVFQHGARFLQNKVGAGAFNESDNSFEFNFDPRESWTRSLRIFEFVCERLFRDKDPLGITYDLNDGDREYFRLRDIQYLIGVGLRGLIEECWRRKTLLIGVVKDSNSRYFYRNFLGSILVMHNEDPLAHLAIQLTDRTILELLAQVVEDIKAPWSTLEFDGCFMTLHPERDRNESGKWVIKGYDHPSYGETTRPERIFLRSLAQFLLHPSRRIASHVIFLDRLSYPSWDDKDSQELVLPTKKFGEVKPVFFAPASGAPRLQQLSMYLLTVLVRNHFPEALGYPDPLHKADWGAKSMEKRITALLESSKMAERSRPLGKTFRAIRDSYMRGRS